MSRADQIALAGARVAIAGWGGGRGSFGHLARAGVGKFNIADFDVYEPTNMNQQFGATVPPWGGPNWMLMEEEALAINPFLEIRKFDTGVAAANVRRFSRRRRRRLADGVDFLFRSAADGFQPGGARGSPW
ncbi:MAG: ThiF family adenylyltransferase [Elusimicrobia bacterium]|nr:ThiF family adenylyltransferase [Elusimicrobiota bacterium]